MDLAANLSFLYKEIPFLDRFRAAATSGFRAVEFGAEVIPQYTKQQLIEAKDAAGVEVVAICAALGGTGDRGLAALPGREEEFKSTLSTALDYSVALKCPRIHCLSGAFSREVRQTESLWWDAEAAYISNLKYAAKECEKHGITVLIEPIAVVPNYFLRHQNQAIEIIKKVACPNLKLEFDFYHAQTLDGNLCGFLTKNISFVGHIQVAQVPGRHEPDDQGEINYSFVFQTLRSLGYEGWIGCEYIPRGKTEDGLGWAAPFLSKD